MATDSVYLAIDGERGAHAFDEAMEKLASGGEMVLDLSSVARVTAASMTAMEKLATAAEEKSVKVALRGVNIDVYRALKVGRLAPRLSFLS